jgi:hypothetical protein
MTNEKPCLCKEGPKIVQSIPEGFKGNVICARCNGIATFQRSREEYKGNDPVEEYLFDAKKNSRCLNYETAMLTMQLRIEKALLTLCQEFGTKPSQGKK